MTQWTGWTDENTLILPLAEARPDGAVDVDGRRFDPKGELHVTLVGPDIGAELRRALGDRLEAATRPAFEALDWSYVRSGRRLLVEKPGAGDDGGIAASIIEPIDLPAMAFFHLWLGELLGRQLPVPPPHITLYTHHRDKGIGLPTLRALRSRTRAELDPASLKAA